MVYIKIQNVIWNLIMWKKTLFVCVYNTIPNVFFIFLSEADTNI